MEIFEKLSLYLRHIKMLKVFGVATWTSKHDLLGKLQCSFFNFGRYVLFVFLFSLANDVFKRFTPEFHVF